MAGQGAPGGGAAGLPRRTPGAARPNPGTPAGMPAGAGVHDERGAWTAYGPDANADTVPRQYGADGTGLPPYGSPEAAAPTGPAGPASGAMPYADGGHAAAAGAGAGAGTATGTGAGAAPVPGAAGPVPQQATGGDDMTDRARQLLIPVADPDTVAAPQPVGPVLPGRPEPRRPQTVHTPGQDLGLQGGVPCPWCATPNHTDRHFCTRCAMPMTREEHRTERLPWWRRLFRRGNEIPWAGDRPRLRRTFDRILGLLGLGIVLTLLIAAAVNVPRAVNAIRDHFAQRALVTPVSEVASRSWSGHPPKLAFDELNNTWWGPGVSGSGRGDWIEARFPEHTRLLDIIITPGVSTHADEISKQATPHEIVATITDAKGKTFTRKLTLDQGPGPQRRDFRVGEVTSVRFTVESSYGTSDKKQVAFAEIEFFGPSHASG